jgi:hypothetical protein
MKMSKKLVAKGSAALAVATIVGVSGGGVASACASDGSDQANYGQGSAVQASTWNEHTSADTASYDQDNLYVQMDPVLREHAPVTVDQLRAKFLGNPDLQAITEAVEMNNLAVADVVEQGYPGTHDQFLELWRGHITFYHQYLDATAAGDEAGKVAAKEGLMTGAAQMSELLAGASDNLDAEELNQSLAVHGEQVTAIIDNLAAGNYSAAWQLNHEAYEHMGMLAELLAYGSNTGYGGEDDAYYHEG